MLTEFSAFPKVSVVVLNWNGCADTLECLESLDHITYLNCEVIVVDNGSTDDSVNLIRAKHPKVRVIENDKNLGFAEGNNRGIADAVKRGTEFVLLLNNDTVVAADLIDEFVSAALAYPDAGAFSGKIYCYSEPSRIWWAGSHWGEREGDFVSNRAEEIDAGAINDDVTESDYACGCAMFIRSELIDRAGALDPLFF